MHVVNTQRIGLTFTTRPTTQLIILKTIFLFFIFPLLIFFSTSPYISLNLGQLISLSTIKRLSISLPHDRPHLSLSFSSIDSLFSHPHVATTNLSPTSLSSPPPTDTSLTNLRYIHLPLS